MFDSASQLPIPFVVNGVRAVASGFCSFVPVRSSRKTLATAIVALFLCKPALAEIMSCPEALYLVKESTTRFSQIKGEIDNESGGITSTLGLPGAQSCIINEGAAKDSYRCTWKYPYRDALAALDFEKIALEFSSCLGDQAKVREDQAVNHPDSYESFLFTLPAAEARVTLKDKRELNSSFVSFIIEAKRNTTPSD